MPHYIQRGEIPPKRHTRFRDADGNLRYEEHVSRQGFAGVYSNLYHLRMASRMSAVGEFRPFTRRAVTEPHVHRHLRTA
ncbi:MAG: homogentisate 1,2-dioxygenase, partial [Candidatus Neomarinimicrobiota bacterium]